MSRWLGSGSSDAPRADSSSGTVIGDDECDGSGLEAGDTATGVGEKAAVDTKSVTGSGAMDALRCFGPAEGGARAELALGGSADVPSGTSGGLLAAQPMRVNAARSGPSRR